MAANQLPRVPRVSVKNFDEEIKDLKRSIKTLIRMKNLYLTNPKEYYRRRSKGDLIQSRRLRMLLKQLGQSK